MKNNFKKITLFIIAIVFWVMIWHLAAINIDSEIFLPTPGKVFTVLIKELLPSQNFRDSLLTSLGHIGLGFIIGGAAGIILAILSAFNQIIKAFIWLPVKIIKSVPVASFVILTLLWFDSEALSVFIPAMIVLPTLYINTLTGIEQTGKKSIEMAKVFRVPLIKKIMYIYIPNTLPYVFSACSLAIGMAWKAGIAAEIIGLAKNSIGNELYKAKIYLMIPELFAWTIVIVLLSIVCENVVKYIIRFADSR